MIYKKLSKKIFYLQKLYKKHSINIIMNITELKEFLINFEINKDIIDKYIQNKEIIELNNNLYLLNNNYNNLTNEVSNDNLIYIHLKELNPSILFLNWIKKNSKNILIVKSEKRALDFTYGKELFTNLVTKHPKAQFITGKNHIIEFDNEILGYIEIGEKSLNNKFHVGNYLKEN